MRVRYALGAGLVAGGLVAPVTMGACLPGDTRPTPGSILLTVQPSESVLSSFATDDGWQVTFEELLLVVGDVGLTDTTVGQAGTDLGRCTSGPYAGFAYVRLLDLTVAGPQKVAQVFGLGDCTLTFQVKPGACSQHPSWTDCHLAGPIPVTQPSRDPALAT